ncbi:DUF4817 domain-containing protein [Trichonephila clavipes]|nr:DUF4817 domain-containing protein [Trichonephila clavipes]
MLSSKWSSVCGLSHRPMTLHSPTENSLVVLNHKILEANSHVQNVKLGGHQTCLSINRLWHVLCDMLHRLVGTTAPGHHDCLLKLVKRFEETGKLEDRARAGRPCLKEARAPCIAVEMEAIASEAASGTSSAHKATRQLGLPSSVRLLKLVKRFEETGKLEDRARAGRPCLKEARAPCIAVEMEAIASEAASGTSSAHKATRQLGLPPSSVRSHWVFNILWTDEARFSLHGDVNNHNCRIWTTSNPREYTQKPLHSPKVTAWCGFTGSFIIGPFFFETQCPVNGWITETINAQRYLTLLRKTVVSCLIQRGQISNVTFMQDGATSHTANPVKAFLIQTFGEDRIVSRRCRYPWPPQSPD